MRKTISTFIVLGCVLALPALLAAQAADSASERIAVLNMQVAIASTGEGKEAMAALRSKYGPKQQELQNQEKTIEQLQSRLQNQDSMMTDDERYQLNVELSADQRHFKDAQEDDQDDLQADQQEAIRKIAQKMEKLITQYAQQHHFDLVLGEQSIPVYYASKAVDITQNIVGLYDSTYPVANPTNAAKPAASPRKGDKPKH
jgi:outer membrane protein